MKLDQYKKVQSIAKNVLGRLGDFISADSTESTIAESAKRLLKEQGVHETWYHDVPAFVLLGGRSCLSLSGRDYEPAHEQAGQNNLITVDLSPSIDGVWGDCARSFVIENGVCTTEPETSEFTEGLLTEKRLHQKMMEYVTPGTRLSELYDFGNTLIQEYGYENLDFLGNLGHTIEARRFIDNQCREKLGGVNYFTFEPHIRKVGGEWGFKHENIYFFNEQDAVVEL